MRIDHPVGSITLVRAEVVLLRDPQRVEIVQVYADGNLVSEKGKLTVKLPSIQWPGWASRPVLSAMANAVPWWEKQESGREMLLRSSPS